MTQQLKTTALYCRLSKDDERQGESLSIETQKSMLVRYAQENGLLPYEIYVDDGYSGLNFERPSFQRINPMLRLRKMVSCSSLSFDNSFPFTLILPEVGVSNPPIMFSKVDLPLPEVPTMATNSPSSMDRVTPSNAFVMFGSVP